MSFDQNRLDRFWKKSPSIFYLGYTLVKCARQTEHAKRHPGRNFTIFRSYDNNLRK